MERSEAPPAQRRDWVGRLRDLTRRAPRASPTDRVFDVWRQGAVILASGLFMTLVGPFGTGGAPFWTSLAYWIGMMTAGTVLANIIVRLAVRLDLFERRPWLWAVLVALVMTPPQTVVVWAASGLTFQGGLNLALLPGYGPPVLLVTLAMLAITVLTQRTPIQTHAAPGSPAPGETPAAPFLDRLPPKLKGAELHAIQAEDHYLRLHTSHGQDIILMRLADALAELRGLEGAQVHRSWWVARDAVVSAERGNGRASLTLKTGAIAPVSRTYAQALRAAGWY